VAKAAFHTGEFTKKFCECKGWLVRTDDRHCRKPQLLRCRLDKNDLSKPQEYASGVERIYKARYRSASPPNVHPWSAQGRIITVVGETIARHPTALLSNQEEALFIHGRSRFFALG
jgi:hypothetical protein